MWSKTPGSNDYDGMYIAKTYNIMSTFSLSIQAWPRY